MKWTTIIIVLLAILAIVSAGQQRSYGKKKCSGKKCLEKDQKYKVKKQLDLGKKNEKLTRQKRSHEEVKLVAEDNIAFSQEEFKRTEGLGKKASRQTAEKKKWAKEIDKQKTERKANRQKTETPKAEKKEKTKESRREEVVEVSGALKTKLNEKKIVASELNVEAHSLSKRSAESESAEPELVESAPIEEIAAEGSEAVVEEKHLEEESAAAEFVED